MGFAWTRNYYAIAETPFPDVFCFESKRSRDSAILCFGLKKISAKEANKMEIFRQNKITDREYKALKVKYLFYDEEDLTEELFVKEMAKKENKYGKH